MPLRTPQQIAEQGPFYKLLNEQEQHYGMKYVTGVNTDVIPFNPSGVCDKGGMYFFSHRQLVHFWKYVTSVTWMRMVAFTPNSRIWDEGDKMKTNEFILGERQPFTIPPDLCLAAVQHDPMALKFVADQTLLLCLTAVQQFGWTLQFVKEQTPQLCLVAVKSDGLALEYVKEQTPEICLAAVTQNGYALGLVEEQTPHICRVAVNQTVEAIEHVKDESIQREIANWIYNPSPFDMCLPTTDQN